jgi:uncharacterized membrane protein
MKNRENKQPQGIGDFSQEDMRRCRIPAALSYLFFFIPMILCPESKYGRFHANQGLLLTLLLLFGGTILSVVPYAGGYLVLAVTFVSAALLIYGLYNALSLKVKPLPVIGRITLIHQK